MGPRFHHWPLIVAAVAAAFTLAAGNALAHERRTLGKYELVVGFIIEPPIEGQKNGVDLRVTNAEAKQPVEGLEKTVQVGITHLPSQTTRTFNLRTIFRDPGHYTSDLILTAPGQYSFHFFGTIEGMPINETFVSGPGRFNDVESSGDLQFPQRLPELREIAGAVKGTQETAEQSRDEASSASNLAKVGIILGALGLASGIGSAVITVRSTRKRVR